MTTPHHNPFESAATISTPIGTRTIYRLDALRDHGDLDSLPYSIKVLLEAALRKCDDRTVTAEDVIGLASYNGAKVTEAEIPVLARTGGIAGLHGCSGHSRSGRNARRHR